MTARSQPLLSCPCSLCRKLASAQPVDPPYARRVPRLAATQRHAISADASGFASGDGGTRVRDDFCD
jgi:hypothetical protein